MSPIYKLNDNDVLSGKGKGVQTYPGNIQFRNMINRRKDEYKLLDSNTQKNELAIAIMREVQCLNPPGRFLIEDANGMIFYELEKDKVLAKVKQALREKSEVKNVMTTMQLSKPLNTTKSISSQKESEKGELNHSRSEKFTEIISESLLVKCQSPQKKKRKNDSLSHEKSDFTSKDFDKMIEILSRLSPKSS
jgi:hypothetical protein